MSNNYRQNPKYGDVLDDLGCLVLAMKKAGYDPEKRPGSVLYRECFADKVFWQHHARSDIRMTCITTAIVLDAAFHLVRLDPEYFEEILPQAKYINHLVNGTEES